MVVAYAIAGRMDIDFETEPLSQDKNGKDVFLRDIWPTRSEVRKISTESVTTDMFRSVYDRISKGSDRWNNLKVEKTIQYKWKS